MGKPKYVYFTDEIHLKLSQEDNASALICGLLNNYYAKEQEQSLSSAEKDIKLAQNIEEKKRELELMQEEHNDLLKEQETKRLEELKIEEENKKERRLRDKWANEVRKIPYDDRPKFEVWKIDNA